ncbi:YihY family inner membrane protein [Microlunatus sagamiharensis]|uniref:YihY family inner membrane protein n=1 Tax=Microlunatus sagamiharensis TaxID=546874 RepID=A0A1H2M5X3_9ACTN|nr:YhjD/YihY/BrkB family envelope integrity protein [Microlunatus sagamiharensis]SDU88660.1 YihY family inner membrane protein [Microlunatus sagamiharensis]
MPTAEVTRTERVPGEGADKPQDIPKQGWVQIAKRGWAEAQADNVPLLAAGMAYYAFLAIFPALIAAVLIYGFFADPGQISSQIDALGTAIPADIRKTITDQVALASGNGAVGFGAIIAILVALFSASGGMGNLMTAVNLCYDEEETRGLVKKRLTALVLTVGAILFLLVVVALVAVLPIVLQVLGTSLVATVVVQVVRWVLVVAVISVALAVLYRVAPDRDAPKVRWVSVGALVATVLWIIASVGFSIYVSQFANYAKTYGAIGSIVILLLWLFITSYAILLGAEINAESEQQTIKDTTRGAPQPLGDRDAVKADSIPEGGDSGTAGTTGASAGTSDDRTREGTASMTSDNASGASSQAAAVRSTVDDPSDKSVGELFRSMSEDLSALVRDEIRLAQAEVGQKAKKAGIGIGAFGGAGVVALYGLGVLIAAAVLGFANVVSPWLAALIVGVILFVVAGVAALVGKKQLSQAAPPVPTDTIASVKTDVAEIKGSIRK